MIIFNTKQILSNNAYQQQRYAIRQQMIDYKEHRRLALGPHANLFFENNKTMWYQVQEMLVTEKITNPLDAQQKIDIYAGLISDHYNWKATLMFEFFNNEERNKQLHALNGIELSVWCDITDCVRIVARADENLLRRNDEQTSFVHFLRYYLSDQHVAMLKTQNPIVIFGVTHPHYTYAAIVPDEMLALLVEDLR